MSVDPSEVSYVQIFPPIGIARLGDSGFDLDKGKPDGDIEYFLPSELPGSTDMPTALGGQFRDSKNRIKRMGVRFRAYAYDKDGTNLGEIISGGTSKYTLTWTVHVANQKGAFYEFRGQYSPVNTKLRNPDVQPHLEPDQRTDLIVDAKQQTISGIGNAKALKGEFKGSRDTPTEVHLGQIRTDEQGRLIFIGGAGYSRSVASPNQPHFQPDIISEFDSIDWVDDACDGWVNVKVEHPDLNKGHEALQKSTVMSAPPKYAWGIQAPTTLYDLIANIYKQETGWEDHGKTQFYQDIWPVMLSSYMMSWTNNQAYQGHGVAGKGDFLPLRNLLATTGKSPSENIQLLREHIFERLRLPDYENPDQTSTKFMPRLSGNAGDALEPGVTPRREKTIKDFFALTQLQYNHFKDWQAGNFAVDEAPWSRYKDIDEAPAAEQPLFLTRAALEHTIGEPLYPGIEMYWIARFHETYVTKPHPFRQDNDPPFRIDHDLIRAGHLSRGLSLPWQSDFDLCSAHWWPSIRPDDVINIRSIPADFKISDGSIVSALHRTDSLISGIRSVKLDIPADLFLKTMAPERRSWSRGLRESPDYPSDYYPGSTDMIRFWNKLGFVAKIPQLTVGGQPIWLEAERMHIDRDKRENQGVFTMPFSGILRK